MLRGFPPILGAKPLHERLAGDDSFDVLQIRAAPQLSPAPPLRVTLAPAAAIQVPGDARVRPFEPRDFTINGQTMDLARRPNRARRRHRGVGVGQRPGHAA